jgi:hypothetical protein
MEPEAEKVKAETETDPSMRCGNKAPAMVPVAVAT